MTGDDDLIKGAFRELRASDAERAPPFDPQRKRSKKGVHAALVLVPSFAVLASAAAIVLWIGMSRPTRAAAPVVVVANVVSPPPPLETEPLGFLLDTPAFGTPDFDSDPGGPR